MAKRTEYYRLKAGDEFLYQRIRYIKTDNSRMSVRISNGAVKDFGYNCPTVVTPVRKRK